MEKEKVSAAADGLEELSAPEGAPKEPIARAAALPTVTLGQRQGQRGADDAECSGANDSKAVKTKVVKRRKRKPFPIALNLSSCKYEVVRIVQKKFGWKEVGDDEDWQVYWTDTSVSIERIMRLKKTQKINHFTGMLEICRKKSLARNMSKMTKYFPDDYKFVPKSYILPAELNEFLSEFSKKPKKKRTWILKPDSGCQGKGIVLAQDAETAQAALQDTENVVAQRYLAKPHLIDGMKYDLRIYVLVVSCDPLRIFIYEEGLVRFCTEPYTAPNESNLTEVCMHLTNYAVNKHNENFEFNDDSEENQSGSKWTLTGLREWMDNNGLDFDTCWQKIGDMVVKTLISCQPILTHNYRSVLPADNDGLSCFELLGMDVMLDHKLKPWLVEVNHSPSFTTDTPLDLAVKEELISDTIELVGVDPKSIKKQLEQERAGARNRLYNNAKMECKLPPTEEELAKIRELTLKQREKHEAKHMGQYTRIYPPTAEALAERPQLADHYANLLAGSNRAFRDTVPHKVLDTLSKVKSERERRLEGGPVGSMGPAQPHVPRSRSADPDVAVAAGKVKRLGPATDTMRSTLRRPSKQEVASNSGLGADHPTPLHAVDSEPGRDLQGDILSATGRVHTPKLLRLSSPQINQDGTNEGLLGRRRASDKLWDRADHLGPVAPFADVDTNFVSASRIHPKKRPQSVGNAGSAQSHPRTNVQLATKKPPVAPWQQTTGEASERREQLVSSVLRRPQAGLQRGVYQQVSSSPLRVGSTNAKPAQTLPSQALPQVYESVKASLVPRAARQISMLRSGPIGAERVERVQRAKA